MEEPSFAKLRETAEFKELMATSSSLVKIAVRFSAF